MKCKENHMKNKEKHSCDNCQNCDCKNNPKDNKEKDRYKNNPRIAMKPVFVNR